MGARACVLLLLLTPAVLLGSIKVGMVGRAVEGSARLSVGGSIWDDANIDGVGQPDEAPIRIINVSLFKAGVEISRIQPDYQGHYAFGGLDPGAYTVRLTQAPDSFFWTYPSRRSLGPYETAVNLTSAPFSTTDFGLTSLEGLPRFGGNAWLDGQPIVGADVRAYVDGNDCTAGASNPFRDILPSSRWDIRVLSSAYRPGCGEKGKPISFTIDGRPAHLTVNQITDETAVWDTDQGGPHGGHLIAGPPFSTFEAIPIGIDLDGDRKADAVPGTVVEAFVGDARCGRLNMLDVPVEYITIASSQLQPGCALQGSPIRFAINDVPVTSFRTFGLDGVHEGPTEPWLEGVRGFDLLLTPPQPSVRPPNTGNAGLLTRR